MRIIHFDAGAWHARLDDGFSDANVARVADALGLVWANEHSEATVLVGHDASTAMAAQAELAGSVMAAYGLRVVVADGPAPLPAVSWAAAHDQDCAGALMLSTTWVGAGWGSMLFRGGDGGPVGADVLASVERAISGDVPAARGRVAHADLCSAYAEDLVGLIRADAIAAASPLVIADAMHGAARNVLPSVLRAAGARVIALHDSPGDAATAGLRPEPIEPWVDECEQLVSTLGATCGIVVGGEGARTALIDERGRIVAPHDLAPLLLGYVQRRAGNAPGARRVITTMSSSARMRRQGERLGYEVTTVPVGFDRIYGEVLEGDVLMAADEYGGVCLPSHLYERDGLLAGLLALELLATDGRPLSQLVSELEREIGHMVYGRRDTQLDAAQIQVLRNVLPGLNPAKVAGRTPIAVRHTEGLHLLFDDDAWMMLRPARTQRVVRAYAEAPSTQQRDELLEAASELARALP